jgi:predicted DCC family thiol-disulfide oxidoreductase YuxK
VEVWVRSEAFIRVGQHLGGGWRLLTAIALIPRPVRDWAYDAFARRRYRIFGRFEACPIPPVGVRSRFLD